jgi:hypothetical protein
MLMSNYLGLPSVFDTTMATERHTGGLFHVTVVPENFDPDADGSRSDECESDT